MVMRAMVMTGIMVTVMISAVVRVTLMMVAAGMLSVLVIMFTITQCLPGPSSYYGTKT